MPALHDPTAFSVGPLAVRWYALFLLTGIFAAIGLATWLAGRRGKNPELLLDMAPWVVFGSIFGARLYFVLLEAGRFRHDPLQALNFRGGGLSIHGAIIAGIVIVWAYIRRQGERPWVWYDLIVPGLALGQAIGRWGNWANQEAFGRPTTVPWAVSIDPERRPAGYEQYATFHPTFLYESICDALLCGFLVWLVLRIPRLGLRDGFATGVYLFAYGVIRLIIESMRTDSLYIGPLPAAYWLSGALIVAGTSVMLRSRATYSAAASGTIPTSAHPRNEQE